MVAVLIIQDGKEENLKKTIDSLKSGDSVFDEKIDIKIVGQGMKPSEAFRTPVQNKTVQEELSSILCSTESRYVTILRAGEQYINDALKQACLCMEKLGEQTDAVAVENLNSKTKKSDRKVEFQLLSMDCGEDILKAPACFGGILFRTEAVREERFDLSCGEGWMEEFICRILMKKQKLGYARGARFSSVSELSDAGGYRRQWADAAWYLDMAESYCRRILENYRKSDGTVPLLLQAQVLYVLRIQFQENMNAADKGVFKETSGNREKKADAVQMGDSESLFVKYYGICRECLREIDRRFIRTEWNAHPERLLNYYLQSVFMRMKYEAEYRFSVQKQENRIQEQWPGELVLPVILQLTEYENGVLRLDCEMEPFLLEGGRRLCVLLNGKEVQYGQSARYAAVKFFGERFEKYAFYLQVRKEDLKRKNTLVFVLTDEQGHKQQMPVITLKYQSRISSMVRGSYWCFERYMITFSGNHQEKEGLRITKAGKVSRMLQELKVLAQMPFGENRSRKMFVQRVRYWLAYPKYHKKNIWLTFDKLYKGGDCGEYFYKYMVGCGEQEITPAYVIQKKAPDRKRLEQEGYRPLIYGSQEQKLSYLYAEMVFATHSSVHGFNGFNAWEIHFIQDRLRAVNTCIQHGLSVQDLTFDSNRTVNNNKRYYCASGYEVENLSRQEYDYGPGVLRLTGIPRYDGLVNRDQRQILITPTWRSYIAMPAVLGSARPYNPEFKNTEYFRIYEELVSDERLSETARKAGYRIIYLLHPILSVQKNDFTVREGVELVSALEINYETILTESSLMVTDYSGVQFDFAYMRKPVVYYQPPSLPPHYVEGGFDYETQGFGEICKEKDALVELLCGYMEQECRLKPQYRARQDDFFAFSDRENCRRIYEDAKEYHKHI